MSKTKDAMGQVRDLSDAELGTAQGEARDALFRLKLQSFTNQVQNTASIRKKRRDLARLLTVMNGRGKGEGQGAAPARAPKSVKPAVAKAPKAVKAAAPAASKKAAPAKKSAKKKEGKPCRPSRTRPTGESAA